MKPEHIGELMMISGCLRELSESLKYGKMKGKLMEIAIKQENVINAIRYEDYKIHKETHKKQS